jgi:hypothetical protein
VRRRSAQQQRSWISRTLYWIARQVSILLYRVAVVVRLVACCCWNDRYPSPPLRTGYEGKSTHSVTATSCKECSAGNYALLLTTPRSDTPGYENKEWSCTGCGTGQYTDESGAISCKPCDLGRFQPYGGAASCKECPTGQYQDIIGQGGCKSCPELNSAGDESSFAFENCPQTDTPTTSPTDAPTDTPTDAPTDAPTDTPTDAPTDAPTLTAVSPCASGCLLANLNNGVCDATCNVEACG